MTVSPYLERPLRTLEQALRDQGARRALQRRCATRPRGIGPRPTTDRAPVLGAETGRSNSEAEATR